MLELLFAIIVIFGAINSLASAKLIDCINVAVVVEVAGVAKLAEVIEIAETAEIAEVTGAAEVAEEDDAPILLFVTESLSL